MSEEIRIYSPEIQRCGTGFCPVPSPWNRKFHLMVTAAKVAPNFHIHDLPCFQVSDPAEHVFLLDPHSLD